MEDKIVEIARFAEPAEAEELELLLKSEGIECYLRNEYTSRIMYPANMGYVRVEILESEVKQAMTVMEANGYELPKEDEETEQMQAISGLARHIPFLRHCPLEKQIMIIFVIIAVLLALFVYCGSLLSSK